MGHWKWLYMENFKIEYLNQNFIDSDIVKKTSLIKTDTYSMGAITTRGTNPKRPFNQDYSAIMTYPGNDNIAILIMADGKDDSENGKIASKELVYTLSNLFLNKSTSETFINIPVLLEGKLLGELRQLNRRLYEDEVVGDVSFALAVIGKEETLIANVGNVRCYSINDDNITLQTTDNLTWYLYNSPELITPDEVKYLIGKDYVSKSIGKENNLQKQFEPFIKIIDNQTYNSLLLTTHGVNDVLDSAELFNILSQNNTEDALQTIIYDSIFSESKPSPKELLSRFKDRENMIIEKTIPGDSNASAIVYKKTKNS